MPTVCSTARNGRARHPEGKDCATPPVCSIEKQGRPRKGRAGQAGGEAGGQAPSPARPAPAAQAGCHPSQPPTHSSRRQQPSGRASVPVKLPLSRISWSSSSVVGRLARRADRRWSSSSTDRSSSAVQQWSQWERGRVNRWAEQQPVGAQSSRALGDRRSSSSSTGSSLPPAAWKGRRAGPGIQGGT